jgi:hypothetical protein
MACNTWIPTKCGVLRSSSDGARNDTPVPNGDRSISKNAEIPRGDLLSFECSPCAICDARSQFSSISGIWITKICSGKLAFEHGSVTQMGCRVLDRQKALLLDNRGKELVCLVYRRRGLKQSLEDRKHTIDDSYLYRVHEMVQNRERRVRETSRVEVCDHRVVCHHPRLLDLT